MHRLTQGLVALTGLRTLGSERVAPLGLARRFFIYKGRKERRGRQKGVHSGDKRRTCMCRKVFVPLQAQTEAVMAAAAHWGL